MADGSVFAIGKASRTMKDIAAVAHWPAVGAPLVDGDHAIQLNRAMVTGNFISLISPSCAWAVLVGLGLRAGER